MRCFHPYCPAGEGLGSWNEVVSHPVLGLDTNARAILLAALETDYQTGPVEAIVSRQLPVLKPSILSALCRLCPCLFNQMAIPCTPRGVVHLCEVTMGERINAQNVYQAFLVQHPTKGPTFRFPPVIACTNGGTVMEMLCSEVLTANGIAAMELDDDKWPKWQMPGHILLNEGKMASLRAFGDILIPCGPTNLVISVKSEAARERLLYSSNSIEGIGFGFFNEPEEFWTASRMNLYKRMGFSAIYLPDKTHEQILAKLEDKKIIGRAVNVNGTPLYRSIFAFGEDMRRVVGKHSLLL